MICWETWLKKRYIPTCTQRMAVITQHFGRKHRYKYIYSHTSEQPFLPYYQIIIQSIYLSFTYIVQGLSIEMYFFEILAIKKKKYYFLYYFLCLYIWTFDNMFRNHHSVHMPPLFQNRGGHMPPLRVCPPWNLK